MMHVCKVMLDAHAVKQLPQLLQHRRKVDHMKQYWQQTLALLVDDADALREGVGDADVVFVAWGCHM